jgi:hypothetical protein
MGGFIFGLPDDSCIRSVVGVMDVKARRD